LQAQLNRERTVVPPRMGAGRIDELLQPSLRALVQIDLLFELLLELSGSATGHVYDILLSSLNHIKVCNV